MIAMILIGLLLLVGIGLGLYFFVFAKKDCKKIEKEDECTEPCQWDTYGNKCIGEDDTLTAAPSRPTPPDEPADENVVERRGPTGATGVTGVSDGRWRCYAGRYGDAYAAYKQNNSLQDVEEHYETIGKSKGWNTTCTLTGDELGCYALQNPEAFSNFGYTTNAGDATGKRLAQHYKEVGRESVARFNCQGGKLAASAIPEDASILTPREFNFDRGNRRYTTLMTSPNGLYTLSMYQETRRGRIFVRKGNTNIATILDSTVSAADYTAGYTKLRAWFSGYDGNLFLRWYKPNGSGGYKSGVYINSGFPGTTDASVPSNQHVLVLTNSGKLYMDHGEGSSDEIAVLYDP